ncbi:hypothetical protein K466DRAFT_588499 [Polyporus arcularius HHB13444]|uniref:Uncharacterized protein n=1 Tax=Polyporus arcularius HHB13444 TaxID=1314778 RepID=A0A5C3P9N9_9APHY|nr:hypothetical protein K466DRAFT_588499 [Polyporus arcularius HHB13444]
MTMYARSRSPTGVHGRMSLAPHVPSSVLEDALLTLQTSRHGARKTHPFSSIYHACVVPIAVRSNLRKGLERRMGLNMYEASQTTVFHGGCPRQQLVSSLAADTAQPSALKSGVPSAGDRPLKAKRLPPTSERNKDRLQSISYGEEGSGGEIEKPDCATGRQATLK